MPTAQAQDLIAALARRVVEENTALGRRVALAESCTGGLVCAALTDVAGSSAVLERGFITYSNEAKMDLLGVSGEIIETFGAVSVACGWAMAQGALKASMADVAVAITGIAGPGGGSESKPVGTVVLARCQSGNDAIFAEEYHFSAETRGAVRSQAVVKALELLLP